MRAFHDAVDASEADDTVVTHLTEPSAKGFCLSVSLPDGILKPGREAVVHFFDNDISE